MKVIFTFSDSSTYESSIIRQGFSCQEILFNRLQASDGFVGFSIPFSTTFSNKMTADINNNVLAVVYDDNNNPYATGFVKKEVGYEQKYRNQPVKITIVSKSYMLDKTLNESYALESYTSAQIVTWLLTQAGISDIGSLSSMTTIVPLFVFNAGENIKDVLKEFCFEYSKTFYFDKNGYFQVADLFISSFTASQTFNRSNIRDRVNINVKEAEANCIRGRWTPLSLVSDTLVFEDKQNATSQYDCVIPIAANSWFGGVEDNFLKCDSTLGEVKYVKAITQNNIQSDTGITKTLDLLERTSLNQLHFTAKNTTASVKNITKMQVYANAYIAKENRVDVTTYGNKEKELSLKYIQDQTTAQNFVKALADYYNSTTFTVSFSSDEVCDIGDLVTVSADGIGSFNCRIIQRTRNIITDTIDYVCENIGDYTPAVIVQTVQEPLAVNIAGGQKGLDGAPGTPGADGKNAITMTSATTPSGEYNGQMGFWQGQPYMWNGSSWVKQIGDLPTDSVLHYSFDEVPDYPDGTAVYFKNKNFTDVSEWGGNATATITDGKLNIEGTKGQYKYLLNTNIPANRILLVRGVATVTQTLSLLVRNDGASSDTVLQTKNLVAGNPFEFLVVCNTASRNLNFSTNIGAWGITISAIYIGDGSYATPIIDNANGQYNSISQSGVAVSGVSGKGVVLYNGNQIISAKTTLYDNFTLSIWVKPQNNTNGLLGGIIVKGSCLILRNGDPWGTNVLVIGVYNKSTSSYQYISLTNTLLPINKFNHIVVIKEGATIIAYLNGLLIKTDTLSFTEINNNNNNVAIAEASNTRPQSYDDLLIFDRALSETEVLALYQNKANTPKYFTKSDYDLDAIDDDSKISPSEKIEILSKWKEIYNAVNVSSTLPTTNITATGEYKALIDDATAVGIEGLQEITDYKNASNAIRDVLWNSSTGYLIPANVNKVTDVTAGALDTLFSTYRQCLQKSRTKISQQQASVASALTISNANPYCLIPVAGGTPNYNNTDNRLQVFNGTTLLTPKSSSSTLSDGQWKVTASGSNITAGSQTVSSTYIDFGNVSNMTSDNATITFTIETRVNGVKNTMYAVQKFAKSVAAADGASYKLIATAYCVKTGTSVTFDAQKNTGGSNDNFKGYLYKNTGSGWSKKGQFINDTVYASISDTVSVDTAYRLCKTDSASDFVDETSVKIYKDGDLGPQGLAGLSFTPVTYNVSRNANGFYKSSGGASTWDSYVRSKESFIDGCVVSASCNDVSQATYIMLGLTTRPDLTSSYQDLDFAWYFTEGNLYIYENGNLIGTFGNYSASTVLKIEYDGYNVKYYADNVLKRTVERARGSALYFASCFYTLSSNKYLQNANILPYQKGDQGSPGSPGTPGQRGAQYLGANDLDPATGIVSGDFYFNNSSDITKGGYLRTYDGSQWSNDSNMSITNPHIFEAIDDIIAWVGDTTHSSISIYTTDQSIANAYVDKLLVGTAFIDKLLVKKLHLLISGQNIGAIFGGKYNENGNIDSQSSATKGVYLDANGTLKCIEGEFEGTIQSNNFSVGGKGGYKLFSDGLSYINKCLFGFDIEMPLQTNWLRDITNITLDLSTESASSIKSKLDTLISSYGQKIFSAYSDDRIVFAQIVSTDPNNLNVYERSSYVESMSHYVKKYTKSNEIIYAIGTESATDVSGSYDRVLIKVANGTASKVVTSGSQKLCITTVSNKSEFFADVYSNSHIQANYGHYLKRRGKNGDNWNELETYDDVYNLLHTILSSAPLGGLIQIWITESTNFNANKRPAVCSYDWVTEGSISYYDTDKVKIFVEGNSWTYPKGSTTTTTLKYIWV